MGHQISIDDFKGYTKNIEMAFSSMDSKELVARIHVHAGIVDFVVYSHKKIVAECDTLDQAIDIYNKH